MGVADTLTSSTLTPWLPPYPGSCPKSLLRHHCSRGATTSATHATVSGRIGEIARTHRSTPASPNRRSSSATRSAESSVSGVGTRSRKVVTISNSPGSRPAPSAKRLSHSRTSRIRSGESMKPHHFSPKRSARLRAASL